MATVFRAVRNHPVRLLVGLVLVWMLAAGAQSLLAYRDISRGTRAAEATRAAATIDSVVKGQARQEFERARESFGRAHRRASGPVLWPVRLVPIAGRQLRSVIALTAAAEEVADVGVDALAEARRAIHAVHRTGGQRVELLGSVASALGDAERRLRAVDLGPVNALVGPLADRRNEFSTRLVEVRDGISSAAAATDGVATLFRGPRRYLVLAANNAEMRAGSGMYLSAGVLSVTDGALSLGDMTWTADLQLGGEGVPISGDLKDRWGWSNPGREWRNLAMTPRFDVTGELAARMWKARTGEDVDGVLALDVEAVRAIVAATGPVTIGEKRVDAATVVRYLMHDQYSAFGGTFDEARAERQGALGGFARAAVSSIEGGDFDADLLAGGLGRAAAGRHVMLWSSHPDEQEKWEAAGVAGLLRKDSLMVSVLNLGANKLDPLLVVGVVARGGDDPGEVELRIGLRNWVLAGEPVYVAGPHPRSPFPAGVYNGLVSVNLPGDATDAAFDPGTELVVDGPDGPTRVLAARVVIPRGEQREVVLRFRSPTGRVHIEPSARVPPTVWNDDDRRFNDATGSPLRW